MNTALNFAFTQLHFATFSVLDPQGPVAAQQRDLLLIATLMMLIVVVPVFALTFGIAWKYRAARRLKPGAPAPAYAPDWDGDRRLEFIWWAVPFALIAALSVLIWTSSHSLDPYRPLSTTGNPGAAVQTKPVTVQVVALQWKWLFIYPELGVASVNYLPIPEQQPINFQITSDAPMNSFWIPQLGGQVYAMSGMTTQLHLQADHPGTYQGVSANLSGKGFAGMNFKAQSLNAGDFDEWVKTTRQTAARLDLAGYQQLALPSERQTATPYVLGDNQLYDEIIMKYLNHAHPETSP